VEHSKFYTGVRDFGSNAIRRKYYIKDPESGAVSVNEETISDLPCFTILALDHGTRLNIGKHSHMKMSDKFLNAPSYV
jgi:hypothetical protein